MKSPVFTQLSGNLVKADIPSENSKSPRHHSNCTGKYQNNLNRNALRKKLGSSKFTRSRKFEELALKKFASQEDDLKIKGNLDNKKWDEIEFQEKLVNVMKKIQILYYSIHY